ncbi:hypothetical protein [Synechococcus sp. H65.1]|uniref:hypothetical protein n=1 Tax=unclassified Synechococcus TaxID=2626047 RepID=UPI0039C3C973
MKVSSWKRWLDSFLIALALLMFAGFVWFVFSVIAAFFGILLGYKLWLRLWLPLFQPLLGLLVASALLSGVWSWLEKRWSRNPDHQQN